MALFKKKPQKIPDPQPLAGDAITIYLADDGRAFDPNENVHITIEGYSPYLHEELTIPLEENQEGLAADRIVYSRIVGGTHHEVDLNNAVFDVGSEIGVVHEAANSHDPNAMAVCRISNKTIYTAGYLPRTLAGVLAPLVPPGDPFNAAVIETVARGGKRIGLKIVGTVGRDMVVKSVSR